MRKENLARGDLAQLIRRTEKSMSAMRDGVVLLDRRQQLETWNQAAAQALGLRVATDRRQAFTNLVRHPQMIEYLQANDFRQPLSCQAHKRATCWSTASPALARGELSRVDS